MLREIANSGNGRERKQRGGLKMCRDILEAGDVMGTTKKDERLIGKAAASNLSPDQAMAQYVARLHAEYGCYAIAIGAVRGMIDGAMGKTTLTELLYESRNEDAR